MRCLLQRRALRFWRSWGGLQAAGRQVTLKAWKLRVSRCGLQVPRGCRALRAWKQLLAAKRMGQRGLVSAWLAWRAVRDPAKFTGYGAIKVKLGRFRARAALLAWRQETRQAGLSSVSRNGFGLNWAAFGHWRCPIEHAAAGSMTSVHQISGSSSLA